MLRTFLTALIVGAAAALNTGGGVITVCEIRMDEQGQTFEICFECEDIDNCPPVIEPGPRPTPRPMPVPGG